MRHQLHKPSIDQDPRTDTVKHPIDNQTRLAPRHISVSDPQPNCNRERRAYRVSEREQVGGRALVLGPGRGGQAGAQPEAFERLVEDEHHVQGVELGAGDGEGEPDEDGVEDDAEFEDEDCGHLRGVVFDFVRGVVDWDWGEEVEGDGSFGVGWGCWVVVGFGGWVVVVDVGAGVGEMVVSGRVGGGVAGARWVGSFCEGFFVVGVGVAEGGVPHCH